MTFRRLHLVPLAAALLLAAAAAGPRVQVDKAWTLPDTTRFRLLTLAVLPTVTFDRNAAGAHYVSTRWPVVLADRDWHWLTADAVRRRLGATPDEQNAALEPVDAEIRDHGQPDPATARALARRLGADGLLCVRVDRWERQPGVRDMYYVDLTATLVDSAGTRLWTSAARARNESEPGERMDDLPLASRAEAVQQDLDRRSSSLVGPASSNSSNDGSPGPSPSTGSGSSSSGNNSSTVTSAGQQAAHSLQKPDADASGLQMLAGRRLAQDDTARDPFQVAVDSLLAAWRPRFPRAPVAVARRE